jgi:hypothetical protein
MHRLPWLERTFHFDIPPGWVYNIISRLEGTEARLWHHFRDIPDDLAVQKSNGKWSIKEHVGHLGDLEELHLRRLSDFEDHAAQLSTWDVTNSATEKANHNANSIDFLIRDFADKRKEFIRRLRNFSDEVHEHQAMHPRLKILMKPVDMATFIAEHDDHHIASMLEILA